MLPLAIRSRPGEAASFLPTSMLDLPLAAETAGWVLPFRGAFRLWINQPADSRTLQLQIASSREIRELDPLPLVAAGAIDCGDSFIVTGADEAGHPLVIGTDADGRALWRYSIEDPPPQRWPTPGCISGKPIVLWQTMQGRVELAEVGAAGMGTRRSFAVGGPPLDLAVAHNSVWAVWSDATGVIAQEASDAGPRQFQLSPSYASEIAVGACAGAIGVAWGHAGVGFLALKPVGADAFGEAHAFELGAASGGALRIIAGDEPLLFASRGYVREDEAPRIISVLTAPGLRPTEIEGAVRAVAYQGETVVLLGETKVQFLRRTREHISGEAENRS